MIGWIRRLFGIRRPDPRRIFRYRVGGTWRSWDPVAVWTRLDQAVKDDWQNLMQALADKPPPGAAGPLLKAMYAKQHAASLALSYAVCQAFEIAEYTDDTPGGMTIPERIALAMDFLDYMDRMADASAPFVKRSAAVPHSPPASATPSGSASGAAAG